MTKCFLSHSSKDKTHYVSFVAKNLSPDIKYDEMTFSPGSIIDDEIRTALESSKIFVLFISSSALDSEYVQKEIAIAKTLYEQKVIKSVFPIIIDKSIRYDDKRIPKWISETYSLGAITSPRKAVRFIREKMIVAAQETHPLLKERDKIFVGRNDAIAKFEQRFDDYTMQNPKVIIASGIPEIGRKSLMRRALVKANGVSETYQPIFITLDRNDGIEGFLVNLLDATRTSIDEFPDLWSITIDEKIEYAVDLSKEIQNENDIITIDDNRCIVKDDGEIVDWFESICNKLHQHKLLFCISSHRNLFLNKYRHNDDIYYVKVFPLEKSERNGLFKRYCDLLNIFLPQKDFSAVTELLSGYPSQALFAAQVIDENSLSSLEDLTYDILQFSSNKASVCLRRYEGNVEANEFLQFLCSLSFFSLHLLEKIAASVNIDLVKHLEDFLNNLICEPIENVFSYYRVNNVIKDFVLRGNYRLSSNYSDALAVFIDTIDNNSDDEEFDISEYAMVVKENLRKGVTNSLTERFLIPAYFMQTIQQLYNERMDRKVVFLADQALENSINFDDLTITNFQFFLCQSLARLQDKRFMDEVFKIRDAQHNFLFGFYYRLGGKFEDAKKRFNKCIQEPKTAKQSRNELVITLLALEEFDEALSLAKDNHLGDTSNPFFAQSYAHCLMNQNKSEECKNDMQSVLKSLENVAGLKAKEIKDLTSAKFEAKFGNPDEAITMVKSAIFEYQESAYPILSMLDISFILKRPDDMVYALEKIEHKSSKKYHFATLKARIKLAALRGDKVGARQLIESEPKYFSSISRAKWYSKVDNICRNAGE